MHEKDIKQKQPQRINFPSSRISNKMPSSLLQPRSIPQEQIRKFQMNLQFLRQRPLEEYAQQQFVGKIRKQAYISEEELQLMLRMFAMEKRLSKVVKVYFSQAFSHSPANKTVRKIQKLNQSQLQEIQNELLTLNITYPQKQTTMQSLYERLILFSSYQTLKAMMFLKNIFEERFIHKKLINQFERCELTKKLQIFQNYDAKRSKQNLQNKKKKKQSIYFKQQQQDGQQEDTAYNKDQYTTSQGTNSIQLRSLSMLKSKIYSILVLEYEKLQSSQILYNKHLKFIQKCINEREIAFKIYLHKASQKTNTNFQDASLIVEFDNLTAYFIVMRLQLKINFQPSNLQYLILKQLKQRKKQCMKVIKQNSQSNNYLIKQLLSESNQLFLISLQGVKNKMKKRIEKELLGSSQQSQAQNNQQSKIQHHRSNSSANYEVIKNSIYELTLNAFNHGSKKYAYDNKYNSNQKILQHYIINHNQVKFKKEAQNKNFASFIQEQNSKKHAKDKSLSVKQTQKSRSLTILRQNLHKNIFPKQQKVKVITKFANSSKQDKLLEKRSRSVFALQRKNSKQGQSSMKTLLQSPLTRQIQIYIEYQKFLKASAQKDQQDKIKKMQTNKIIYNTQQPKANQNGLKLISQMSKFKTQKQTSQKKLLTNQKRKKINTIYKAFAYNNKIVDISHWKLQQQIQDSIKNCFFSKKIVGNQLNQPICKFGVGIRDLNSQLDQLFTQKCYMGIRFVKFWQSKLYFYNIRLTQESQRLSFYIKMNDQSINLVLPRGNNILCERYNTIWPTIRYLFQKKILQFPIIKFFQQIFYQKKTSQPQSSDSVKNNQSNDKNASYKQVSSPKKPPKINNKNSKFQKNQCKLYEGHFGQIKSEQMQEINLCFDYIHKFIGLISSKVKKQNGFKDIIWPLHDNSLIRQFNQISDIGYKNKQKILVQNTRSIQKTFLWRRIAKLWVSMQKLQLIHLLSFYIKIPLQNYSFVSVSIQKAEITKIIQIFLSHNVHYTLTQKQKQSIFSKYKKIQVKFNVVWRSSHKFNSKDSNFLLSDTFKMSFQRLQLCGISLKFLTETVLNIIVDNHYHSRLTLILQHLLKSSLYFQTSVYGQKIYDIFDIKNKNIKFINQRKFNYQDYYKHSRKQGRQKQNLSKSFYNSLSQNTFTNLNKIIQRKDAQKKDICLPQINQGDFKYQLQVIQNFTDMLSWNNREVQVKFKPNSKWRIVQKNIHTIITFVNHLSKKSCRKSSQLTTQKIRQHHRIIEQDLIEARKHSKISTLMLRSLQKVKRTVLNFLQKIQSQIYRVRVTLIESFIPESQQGSWQKKWMAECTLIKNNSKQYQKFYVSSADVDMIFKNKKQELKNFSEGRSASYENLSSFKQAQIIQPRKTAPRKSTIFKLSKKVSQSQSENLEIQFRNLIERQQQQRQTQKKIRSKRFSRNSQFQAERSFSQRKQTFSSCSLGQQSEKKIKTKQRRLRLFRKIIQSITFTRIKCFNKILISNKAQITDPNPEKFIAQPRTSLQILHHNFQDNDKLFELKYFIPFQNRYQTVICKPIKVRFKDKVDYVIITLFKIQLELGQKIYQLRVNLNKNQTYYACEMTEGELRELVDHSLGQKVRQKTAVSVQSQKGAFLPTLPQANNEAGVTIKAPQDTKKPKSNFPSASSIISMEDISKRQVFRKKKGNLKSSRQMRSNFLKVQENSSMLPASRDSVCERMQPESQNALVFAIVGKLEQFSKQVLENIFKKIQISTLQSQSSVEADKLVLEIQSVKFKKQLKLRLLQRISTDRSSIYIIEINEKVFRRLNRIFLKNTMNNNFDIFRQNIFKNHEEKEEVQFKQDDCLFTKTQEKDLQNVSQYTKSKQNQNSAFLMTSNTKSAFHQSQISLLFTSFLLYEHKHNNLFKIPEMNQQNVIANISFDMEKRYGKHLLLKFNTKKIKSYAQIFLNYYLKYGTSSRTNSNEN